MYLLPAIFIKVFLLLILMQINMSHAEEFTLKGTLRVCLDSYRLFSNPIPFQEDEDYCDVPANRFIDGVDESRKAGFQLPIRKVLRQVKGLFSNPKNGSVTRQLSREIGQCIDTYHDIQSLRKRDTCIVELSPKTVRFWKLPARKRVKIDAKQAIWASYRALSAGNQEHFVSAEEFLCEHPWCWPNPYMIGEVRPW